MKGKHKKREHKQIKWKIVFVIGVKKHFKKWIYALLVYTVQK